jgi:hypothetical protein
MYKTKVLANIKGRINLNALVKNYTTKYGKLILLHRLLISWNVELTKNYKMLFL